MNFIYKFFLIFATTVVCCQSLYTTTTSTDASTTEYFGPSWCEQSKFLDTTRCVSYDCRSNISCPDNSRCCFYGENQRTCCQSLYTITPSTEVRTTEYVGSYECPGKPSNTSCVSYDCSTPGSQSGISCPDDSYCCVYEENGRTCCKFLAITAFLDGPTGHLQ